MASGPLATPPAAPCEAPPDITVGLCEEESTWNAFLGSQESGSFYHLAAWQRVNGESFGHRSFPLAAYSSGALVGVLPLVLVESRLFGRILCSMPFVNFGGPCATHPAVEQALARAAIAKASELSVRLPRTALHASRRDRPRGFAAQGQHDHRPRAGSRHVVERVHVQAPQERQARLQERARGEERRHRASIYLLSDDGRVLAQSRHAAVFARVLRARAAHVSRQHASVRLPPQRRAGRGRAHGLFQRRRRGPVGRRRRARRASSTPTTCCTGK